VLSHYCCPSRALLTVLSTYSEAWGSEPMGWLPAGDEYEVALVEGRVAARATGGRAAAEIAAQGVEGAP